MRNTNYFSAKLIRGLLAGFLLWGNTQGTVSAQTIMFDDFTYSSASDAQIAAFNKWSIVDGVNGPPSGAQYSRNNIKFIDDPNLTGNKLMTLSTTVNGTTKATTHSRIETNGYDYFEGTYAARVYFDETPFTYKDANIQTFYTIVSYLLGGDGSRYSELDFEYMAADKWGTATDRQVMYMTSWNRYIAEPWQAWKNYFADQKSWAGWHTCVVSCTDKVNVKFWIDGIYFGSMAKTDNDGTSVYPRNPMQVAFANWIWNNVVGTSTANRTSTMQVDWTLFYKDQEILPAQVNTLVATYRSQGLQRRNLAGQTYYTTVSNQAPTISLTAPTNNTNYNAPANITITANASDADGSIAKVEFYNGTTLLNSDATAPYSFAWTNVGVGTYTITAKATDNAGATTTSSAITVKVNTVAVTQSPYGGTAANIPGTVQAENYDLGGQGIAFNDLTTANEGASYRTDAVDIEAVSGGGYNIGWTAAGEWTEYSVNVAAGTYKIDARVAAIAAGKSFRVEMDGATIATFTVPNTGGWQTWQTVTVNNVALTAGQKIMRVYCITDGFNIDNIVFTNGSTTNVAPTVSLTAPTNNSTYIAPANVNMTANATDADGSIAKVEFFNGTTLLNSDATAPYSFAWNNIAAGTYTITAKATDNAGAVTTSNPVSITVNNAADTQAPTVSLTSPANNATFNAPASITITANASDNIAVSRVEFYNGATLLNSDATSPYSFAWNNVAAGTYAITAKAFDAAGNNSTSVAANITVNTVNTGGCTGIVQYTENGGYVAGSKVQNSGSQYQCKPFPFSGWCNGAAWAYAPGTGVYWSDAWTLVGSCNARANNENSSATVNETLLTNSPNPFSGNTTIEVNLAEAGKVSVQVFNKAGQIVETILEGNLSAGNHTFNYNTESLTPDMYIVKCTTNNGVITRKIIKNQ